MFFDDNPPEEPEQVLSIEQLEDTDYPWHDCPELYWGEEGYCFMYWPYRPPEASDRALDIQLFHVLEEYGTAAQRDSWEALLSDDAQKQLNKDRTTEQLFYAQEEN